MLYILYYSFSLLVSDVTLDEQSEFGESNERRTKNAKSYSTEKKKEYIIELNYMSVFREIM